MAIPPEAIAAIGGLVSGLFGKRPKYDEPQRIQLDIARRMQEYSRGAPGSDPQEMAALAQARGMMGQEQQQGLDLLMGSLSPTAQTSSADMLRNIGSSFAGERGTLNTQMLLEFLNRRRQAMLGAAQVAGGVGAPRDVRQNQLPAMFGQLAQLYAQQQAMRQGQGGGGGDEDGGSGGFFPAAPGTVVPGANRGAIPGMPGIGAQSVPWTAPAGGQMMNMAPTSAGKWAPIGAAPALQPWRPGERQRRTMEVRPQEEFDEILQRAPFGPPNPFWGR